MTWGYAIVITNMWMIADERGTSILKVSRGWSRMTWGSVNLIDNTNNVTPCTRRRDKMWDVFKKSIWDNILFCYLCFCFALVIEYYLSNNERVGHRKSFDLQLIGIRKPGYWHQFSPHNPYVIDINLCLCFNTILFSKSYIVTWQIQLLYIKYCIIIIRIELWVPLL